MTNYVREKVFNAAPCLKNSRFGRGEVVTRIVDGACVAVDPATAEPLAESARLARLVEFARPAVAALV